MFLFLQMRKMFLWMIVLSLSLPHVGGKTVEVFDFTDFVINETFSAGNIAARNMDTGKNHSCAMREASSYTVFVISVCCHFLVRKFEFKKLKCIDLVVDN